MSSDSFQLSLLKIFSLGIKKSDSTIKLLENEHIILRSWSWKRMGYIRKSYTLKNGEVIIQML